MTNTKIMAIKICVAAESKARLSYNNLLGQVVEEMRDIQPMV